MAITDRLSGIFQRGQSLLGETAAIAGVTVPVVRGVPASLGMSFEEGFSPAVRRVRLSYLKADPGSGAANPVPRPTTPVAFNGVNYRVETADDLPAIWEVECVQEFA